MRLIFNSLLLLLALKTNSQSIEISQNKNTYIYVKGLDKITVDIGTADVVQEINSVGDNYVIKLRATKPFKKSSLMLMSETVNLMDLPVFEIKYVEESNILKYTLTNRGGSIDFNDGTKTTSMEYSTPEVKQPTAKKIEGTTMSNEKEFTRDIKETKDISKEAAIASEHAKKLLEELDNKSSRITEPKEKNEITDEIKADRLPYKFIDGKKQGNLRIELIKIAGVNKKNIYYYFIIANNSGQDYEIEDINFEIKQKKKSTKKQSSSSVDSQVEKKDLIIKAREEKEIKYKSNYFSLSQEEELMITIFEKTDYGRGRSLELSIDYNEFSRINNN